VQTRSLLFKLHLNLKNKLLSSSLIPMSHKGIIYALKKNKNI